MTGGGAFFGISVLSDLKNSKKVAVYLDAGGLGLPERDYYLKTDEKSKETREKYKAHLANLFKLSEKDRTIRLKQRQQRFWPLKHNLHRQC